MIAIALIVLILTWWTLHECKKPINFPPGPKWWPIVGNIPLVRKILSETGYQYMVWDSLVNIYGPIVGLKLGNHKVILVSGYNLIKEVSAREEFEGRPDGFYWRMRAQGQRLGVVFIDGPIWAEHRKFSIQHLKKLGYGSRTMELLIEEEAMVLVNYIKNNSDQPIDIAKIFIVPVLNIIWTLIAGKRYDWNDEKLIRVCNAIHTSFRLLDSSGGILQQLPFLRHIAPQATGYSAMAENHRTTQKFLNETMEEHKRTIQPGIDRDLIDAFLHKIEESGNENTTFTEQQLRVLCMDFLQAGSDTTGNTIGFFMLYMITYQDVQRKIHEEIDTVIGMNRNPQLQDRMRMPYMSAVMLEVHRIASVANVGVPHRVCSDTNLAGYFIPKDVTVLLLLRNMHMDKHWGDPHVFRPERFFDEKGKLIQDDWLGAFGYGRRKCIGENLAKANIFLFSVYLLQNFQVVKNPLDCGEPSLQPNNGITLAPKSYKPIWIARK